MDREEFATYTLADGTVAIETTEYKALCQAERCLINIQDYLEYLAKGGNDSVNINIMAIMAGIPDEVVQLRKEHKEAADNGKS